MSNPRWWTLDAEWERSWKEDRVRKYWGRFTNADGDSTILVAGLSLQEAMRWLIQRAEETGRPIVQDSVTDADGCVYAIEPDGGFGPVFADLLTINSADPAQPLPESDEDRFFAIEEDEADAAVAASMRNLNQRLEVTMSEFTLPRSGDAPLRFTGELLAEHDGYRHLGQEYNRYHELAIYRINQGQYVVRIGYQTSWQGEADHELVQIMPDSAAVRRLLKDHDPTAHVRGFPAGKSYEEKQTRLLQSIRSRYADQVSKILAGEAFSDTAENALAGLEDRRDLHRYRRLIQIGLREIDLTEAEASLLCDANNGIGSFELMDPDHSEWRFWPANVEDSIRLNHLDRKWEVDAGVLLGKVRAMTALQLMAVADAMERFWREPQRDSGEMLRELGLVR